MPKKSDRDFGRRPKPSDYRFTTRESRNAPFGALETIRKHNFKISILLITIIPIVLNTAIIAYKYWTPGKSPFKQESTEIDLMRPKSIAPVSELHKSSYKVGFIEGSVVDTNSKPIVGVTVSLDNGHAMITDYRGYFLFADVPAGTQVLVATITTGSISPKLEQHIIVKPGETSSVNIIYDIHNGTLNLIAISSPITGGFLDLHIRNGKYGAPISGLCSNLREDDRNLTVWIFTRQLGIGPLWKADHPAIIDTQRELWQAYAQFGEAINPPKNGDEWEIVAVAAAADSEMSRVLNTPQLSALPKHDSSNVVTVKVRIP